MKNLIYLFFLITITSCVKLPMQTIDLTDAIIEEGKRIHVLNMKLINKMFDEKRRKIDVFIKNEFTPKYLENIDTDIPDSLDFKEEFPKMIEFVVPEINSRRDNMQSALEAQRINLIAKLNDDFKVFEEASKELKNLIGSVVKVSERKMKAFEQIKGLTKSKIDLNQIETEIDKFITKSGNVSENINELNNTINSLLNN